MISRSGSYTANLLGNIRSHLAGLQGYDVMALELIQNADDAKAESVVFDVTDNGLVAHNAGKFRYCGDLWNHCPFPEKTGQSCDFHRIVDVGSGGKLASSENIGRFGIGFVSCYQITDHPQIASAGLSLTLLPELGEWRAEVTPDREGTTFVMPWASDPASPARKALGISHISAAHREQLLEDFKHVLHNSLLFLRYVRHAELRYNGELVLGCDLDRSDGSDLILSTRPTGNVERWHILRADAGEDAKNLHAVYPVLAELKRSTTISIGLRVEPISVRDGLLYAYLPTEQLSGLPLHLNADFFPESDRKALIFGGHQYQEAWNAMLIAAAANTLAVDMEGLLNLMGHEQFWALLNRAHQLFVATTGHPLYFKNYWQRFKEHGQGANILLSRDGAVRSPLSVFQSRSPLNEGQAAVLHQIGCHVAAEELRPHFNAVGQMGSQILTLERLAGALAVAVRDTQPGSTTIDAERVKSFYLPLWDVVEELLPESSIGNPTAKNAIAILMEVPFLVTSDLFVVTPSQSHAVPVNIDPERVAELLPRLAICTSALRKFPKLHGLVSELGLSEIAVHLEGEADEEAEPDAYLTDDPATLRDFYSLLATLDQIRSGDADSYRRFKALPVWPSAKGLIGATQALLPGDFRDPTGQAQLLDPSLFTDTVRTFVVEKIGVPVQTIEAFVRTVLPRLFTETGPNDPVICGALLNELAKHTSLVNDAEICRQLGLLPMVPSRAGGWSSATTTYRRSDALVKVLGDRIELWLDTARFPQTKAIHNFLDSIGLRVAPSAEHLVDRVLELAQSYLPTDEIRRASGEAFYALCENFDRWHEESFFQKAISRLRNEKCLPAIRDVKNWHAPKELYAPFRPEAIQSQAKVLDLRNMTRLSIGLLELLGVRTEFETQLVLNHLRHCVRSGIKPNVLTYQVLNERAGNDSLVEELRDEPCIYVGEDRGFVTPNRLYWMPQKLGRYASTIPDSLGPYRTLFEVIGVRSCPGGADFADILLEIVEANHERSTPLTDADHVIYRACLLSIAEDLSKGDLSAEILTSLREAPSILNLERHPSYPDELLLQDSEWLAQFFDADLDAALCSPDPEARDLYLEMGVRRLSEVANVRCVGFVGDEQDEDDVARTLRDRATILERALHDKPRSIRTSVRLQVEELCAVSYEVVRVQVSVIIGKGAAHSPPSETRAFFDTERRKLIISRPIGPRVWSHVLNALLHSLMPEESGSEISKLTLGIGPLLTLHVEEAHRALDDAGIPRLQENAPVLEVDTNSGFLGGIGVENENEQELGVEGPNEEHKYSSDVTTQELERSTDPSSTNDSNCGTPSQGNRAESNSSKPLLPDLRNGSSSAYGAGSQSRPRSDAGEEGRSSHAANPTPRPQHKVRRDRRLLSYVRKDSPTESGSGEDSGSSNYDRNLQVEAAARDAVCRYETERGRLPEQMAQTHPGYDIISRDPQSGESRYIEVKGIDGAWSDLGVGLSRTQFNMAQERVGQYWLYVVEFAFDSTLRTVLPLKDPAGQVDSFMFDGNWRDLSEEESTDPARAFAPGVEVRHRHWKDGRIISVDCRGSERVMLIEFYLHGTRRVTWDQFDIHLLLEEGDVGTQDA